MQVQIFLFLLDRIRHDRMRFHRTSRQDVFRPFANDSKWKTIEAFTCFYECNYGQSYKTAGQQIHLQSENKRTMSRYTAKQQDVNLLTRKKKKPKRYHHRRRKTLSQGSFPHERETTSKRQVGPQRAGKQNPKPPTIPPIIYSSISSTCPSNSACSSIAAPSATSCSWHSRSTSAATKSS